MELSRSAWTQIASDEPRILLVPLGSCEQHGPHLPFDTDTRIAVAVASRVADCGTAVHLAPALAYGSSGEHQSFPGTLSMGTDALIHVLGELGRSAFPESKASPHVALVFVNGHGGNTAAVRAATEQLRAEGRPVYAWWPSFGWGDAHAGITETSLLLSIAPDVVGDERPVGATMPLAELLVAMREGGVAAVSANGVLGDATDASAELGARLLDAMAADLDALVARLADTGTSGRAQDDSDGPWA